jgi:transcriptional regulator with XRE-family HTH domain
LSEKISSPRLRLVAVTKAEEQLIHRRRGWWIRVARERLGWTLETFAEELGYADGKGTVSLWEKGLRPVPASKFHTVARLLHLPDRYLVRPPLTDEERLDEAIQSASDAERADWDLEAEQGLEADDGPDVAPGRQSA